MIPTSEQRMSLEESSNLEIKKASEVQLSPELVQKLHEDLAGRLKTMKSTPEGATSPVDLIQRVRTALSNSFSEDPKDITLYMPLKNIKREGNILTVTWELMLGRGGRIYTYQISEDESSLTFLEEKPTPIWMA